LIASFAALRNVSARNGTIGITKHPQEAVFIYKKFTNGSSFFTNQPAVSAD